ncbi:MAG: hypothetical protein V7K61_19740 [Nostoc sp.]
MNLLLPLHPEPSYFDLRRLSEAGGYGYTSYQQTKIPTFAAGTIALL